jgi:hypothetical protein
MEGEKVGAALHQGDEDLSTRLFKSSHEVLHGHRLFCGSHSLLVVQHVELDAVTA